MGGHLPSHKNHFMSGRLYTYIVLLLSGLTVVVSAQNSTVSGYIRDKESGEFLISANCVEPMLKRGASSNSSGYYSITLPRGKISLQASYVGYNSYKIDFNLQKDTIIDFMLSSLQLEEIVIRGNDKSIFRQSNTGLNIIPVKIIASIPSFIGEPDIIRAVTFLPGVSEGREGFSDFYVRGGDRGQNLVLLDGAKVYNTNHLGGFLSLFNSDVIKSADLYKGGFPSRFGGRASSVLDIHTREGNKNEFHSKFKLGILQSSLLFEGPVKNQNTSYLISVRGSYLDLLTLPIRIKNKLNNSGSLAGYTFLDLNMKINHQIDGRNKVFANFYSGLDFQSAYEIGRTETSKDQLHIQTSLLTLGHTFIPGSKSFLKTSIIFSDYGNRISSFYSFRTHLDNYYTKLSSRSSIRELSLKSIFDWNPNGKHSFKTGIEINKYMFIPGRLRIQNADFVLNTETDTLTGSLILPFLKPPELFFKVKVFFLIKHLLFFSAYFF